MGEIRSALDIALEKTASIQSDKTGAENRDLKNTGKKAAGEYIDSGNVEFLSKALTGKKEEQVKLITEGAISVFLAGLRLPAAEQDLEKLGKTGAGLEALLPGSGMTELFSQIAQVFTQYLGERERLAKALEQQFMPRLRAKQQELSKRYGQNVPLDPSLDPEYGSALNKNNKALDQKYEAVIDEVRARVREAAGIES
jgi:hypothetical protein